MGFIKKGKEGSLCEHTKAQKEGKLEDINKSRESGQRHQQQAK
mgnify:CR=1 FL=1